MTQMFVIHLLDAHLFMPDGTVAASSAEFFPQTWSAGPLFRREARLTEQGYMVRQEYHQDGTISCSLVRDMPGQSD